MRLVNESGDMVGVVTRQEAINSARELGLDLVEISPNADPPVCKILDYGKFKFEQEKKRKESKKKQKVIEVKEIQIRPMIDDHDLTVKCKAIKRFIEEGNKVKVVMRFRGREMSHQEIGMDILTKIKIDFEELVKVDNAPKIEGRQIIMMFSPK